MPKPLGVGVVGAGSIGIRGALDHLVVPDVHDRVCATAVCDPVPGRAQAAGAKYDVPGTYDTFEELLADPAVDAVTLCSPIGLHYDQGLAAIRAGKHVHFNKTITVNSQEATHLIDEAKTKGVHLVASPGQMLRTVNQNIRDMIANGDLGKLSWAVTGAAFGSYHEQEGVRSGSDVLTSINPSWYWRKPGGGPLYDMTVYGLHTLTGILGPALRVTAMSGVGIRRTGIPGTDPTPATPTITRCFSSISAAMSSRSCTAPSPAGSAISASRRSSVKKRGSVVGTKWNGTQPVDYPGRAEGLSPDRYAAAYPRHTLHQGMDEAHVFEDLMQLVDMVNEGKPTLATAEHARHVVEIIEAGYKAAETGMIQPLKTTF